MCRKDILSRKQNQIKLLEGIPTIKLGWNTTLLALYISDRQHYVHVYMCGLYIYTVMVYLPEVVDACCGFVKVALYIVQTASWHGLVYAY